LGKKIKQQVQKNKKRPIWQSMLCPQKNFQWPKYRMFAAKNLAAQLLGRTIRHFI
jgi:hypothetical protein